jgi:hypothetical protein
MQSDDGRPGFVGPMAAQALDFLDAIADKVQQDGNPEFAGYLSTQIVTGVVAFVQRGSITPRKINAIQNAMSFNRSMELAMTPEDVRQIYALIHNIIGETDVNLEQVFMNLKAYFTANTSMRISLLVDQARGGGASPAVLVCKAIHMFPDFPGWSFLKKKFPEQWDRVVQAGRMVARQPLIGFSIGTSNDVIKGTGYGDFVWTAVRILQEVGQQMTLRNYKGRFTTVYAVQIDSLITTYGEERSRDIVVADYKPGGQYHINLAEQFPDLDHIQTALEQVGNTIQ